MDRGDLLLRMSDKADRISLRKVVEQIMQENAEAILLGVCSKVQEMIGEKWTLTKDQVVSDTSAFELNFLLVLLL